MDTGGLFLKGKAIIRTVHTLYVYAVVVGFSPDHLVVGYLNSLKFSFWKGKAILKTVHTLYLYAVVIGSSTDYLVVGCFHFLEFSFSEGKSNRQSCSHIFTVVIRFSPEHLLPKKRLLGIHRVVFGRERQS